MTARVVFVELPVRDIGVATVFYERVFGWDMVAFGPSYACTMTEVVDVGLQGDGGEAPAAPLAVIAVENLEVAQTAVLQSGGSITRAPFAFPGGRRFHFRDTAGNELAAMVPEPS